jgi:hypothetical protein
VRRFYYSIAGEDAQGPIWEDEFQRMRAAGALPETARVRIMGARAWTPLAQFLQEEAAAAEAGPQSPETPDLGAPWRRAMLKNLAIAILLVGFCGASLIYWNSRNSAATGSADTLNWQNSRRDSYELEKNVGKFGVEMAQWVQWGSDLTHSRTFALILLGASLATSALLFAKVSSMPSNPE